MSLSMEPHNACAAAARSRKKFMSSEKGNAWLTGGQIGKVRGQHAGKRPTKYARDELEVL